MQRLYSPDRDRNIPFVWAVGVFDGFHRGHRALLARTCEIARSLGAQAGVLTFHPHPRQVLFGTKIPLISPLSERVRLLCASGASKTWVVEFTSSFARLFPEQFLRYYFKVFSSTRGIVVGEDFTFGRGGKRNRLLLHRFARQEGIRLEIFPWVLDNRRKISSQRIRVLIGRGEMEQAARLLGRSFSMTLAATRGKGRGRALGFPTVNLLVPEDLVQPRRGVYIVRFSARRLTAPALANFGVRPTFESESSLPVLEIFIPNADLHIKPGAVVSVHFLKFLRAERRFRSPTALVNQIRRDLAIFSDFVHTHHWESYGKPTD